MHIYFPWQMMHIRISWECLDKITLCAIPKIILKFIEKFLKIIIMSGWIKKLSNEQAVVDLREKRTVFLEKMVSDLLFQGPTDGARHSWWRTWSAFLRSIFSYQMVKHFLPLDRVNNYMIKSHDNLKKKILWKWGLACVAPIWRLRRSDDQTKWDTFLIGEYKLKLITSTLSNERNNNLSAMLSEQKGLAERYFCHWWNSSPAKSENHGIIITSIGPKITIEVSATPQLANL